jgi:hypothetical protein
MGMLAARDRQFRRRVIASRDLVQGAGGSRLFVALAPLWLLGVILPSISDPDNMQLAQFGSFVWLPLIGTIVGRERFLLGPVFRERKSVLVWAAASILAILASALLSEDPAVSLGFVGTAALGLMCCAGLWVFVGPRMTTCIAAYAALGTALVTYAYYFGPRVQGRLSIGTAHPNYLGVASYGILMCALAMPSRIFAGALVAVNLLVIVDTQSRSALGAALVGLLVYVFLNAIRIRSMKAAFALATGAVACGVVLVSYYDTLQEWFATLFFLNDRYRGLGTGFTGRVGAWQEAIELFQDNPVFGVGFRMHERYMTLAVSAHNGYLSLLAEVGAVGSIALFGLTAVLCWRLLRRALTGDRIAIVGVSFVAGYLFIAAFERLFLNMGNPTSILAWLFLLVPAKAARPVRAPSTAIGLPQRPIGAFSFSARMT